MTQDPAAIAADLSRIESKAISAPLHNGCLRVMAGLPKRGLCNAVTGRLTKLGLSVRQIREEQDRGE